MKSMLKNPPPGYDHQKILDQFTHKAFRDYQPLGGMRMGGGASASSSDVASNVGTESITVSEAGGAER